MTSKTEQPDSAGAQILSALTAVLRWASRGDVRRELWESEGVDLSPTGSWLLAAIGEWEPIRATDLATWQGVDKSTITPQVRRLEDAGLIRRTADAADRRVAWLSITAKGRRVWSRINRTGGAMVDGKLAHWSNEDQHQLATLLGRFVRELSDDPPNGHEPRRPG